MLAFRSSFVNSSDTLRFISIVFAAWLFGTLPCFAASNENVAVRHIGHLNSTIVLKVLSQVHIVPFSFEHDSPILLQGKTMLRLHHKQKHELKATYRAGYSIVLLDATMQQIKALHEVIGASVTADSSPCRATIPAHAGPLFQSMPGHDSGACRATIPVDAGGV